MNNQTIRMADGQSATQPRPRLTFTELSEQIKDWLTSVTATETVVELNNNFSVLDEDVSIVPRLITRLVVGKIKPENFVDELKTNIGTVTEAEAKTIASTIKGRILRPVAADLKSSVGVDIDLIPVQEVATPGSQMPKPDLSIPAAPQPFRPAAPTPSPFSARSAYVPPQSASVAKMTDLAAPAPSANTEQKTNFRKEIFSAPPAPSNVKGQMSKVTAGPFILHEEKPLPSQVSPRNFGGQAEPAGDKRFSFATPPRPDLPTQKPAEAKFGSGGFTPIIPKPEVSNETSAQSAIARQSLGDGGPSQPGSTPRIVHYTSYRTMLDESGLKKPSLSSTNSEPVSNLRTKTNSQKSNTEAEKIKEKIFADEEMLDKETLLPPG